MNEFSLLIGGKAGFGIDKSATVIGLILNRIGQRVYIYRDYPSLIRGGHTFSIIRTARKRIAAHQNKIDFILALNQDTFDLHKDKLKDGAIVIYDPDSVKIEGLSAGVQTIGIPITKIVKEENAPEIMRNTCIIGAFVRAGQISWDILDAVFRKEFNKEADLNLKIARRGYDATKELVKIEPFNQEALPLVSGNQALSLGLIKGGLTTYIAYPMTPSSPILHFLAESAENFGLKVIHPESEIGVMLMALGFSYMGEKTAVGTSGGGFCLMTEGLSFAGMAELPIVIVLGQRPGPSTGLPTYSSQTDLHFALNAGQGEFARFIVAPADAEESYFWAAKALNISWKYQIPSIILTDKNLGEGVFNFDINSIPPIKEDAPVLWGRKSPYQRYQLTENGISGLAFAGDKCAVVKVNSYEHDEYGITTEDPVQTVLMQDKRLLKEKYLRQDLEKIETVKVYGKKDSTVGLLCWGSNKGVCVELADKLGLKVIQPIVLAPFSIDQFQRAVSGVKKLISVENNATAQLARLLKMYGIGVDKHILKYDGRPFSLDELEKLIKEAVK
ncbi:MAG: 2-oxoacid:acceptor oxidoreductase subunit alpha [Candidatus Omnitrophica bacterium]|nr:2-oxoacid:acceptor oxidoreductase subunit alpha [Candidatus Omnitrophota bacterium]MDD5237154.1 2-oxoacid:acceptor oxidoreductase subunit alpha [Candidatus Omnitrophota bacterium]MDD5610633.1 2-oxoacid:acceptor oxidoreductase subunit alpha [Candidatus Omnitrophota bacterium]